MGYHCEVTVYSFQLDKDLFIVYMNTLQVGYTSKAHRFTSQIVSQMWSLVQSLTEMQIFLLTHPMGHFRVIFFRKNWDLSYRHIIYLGHPLKLKGVWENIILGDFTGPIPTRNTRSPTQGMV